jgi:hypothetical protein
MKFGNAMKAEKNTGRLECGAFGRHSGRFVPGDGPRHALEAHRCDATDEDARGLVDRRVAGMKNGGVTGMKNAWGSNSTERRGSSTEHQLPRVFGGGVN